MKRDIIGVAAFVFFGSFFGSIVGLLDIEIDYLVILGVSLGLVFLLAFASMSEVYLEYYGRAPAFFVAIIGFAFGAFGYSLTSAVLAFLALYIMLRSYEWEISDPSSRSPY
jgi:hypothetical protein